MYGPPFHSPDFCPLRSRCSEGRMGGDAGKDTAEEVQGGDAGVRDQKEGRARSRMGEMRRGEG